jgi:hypothetical protein
MVTPAHTSTEGSVAADLRWGGVAAAASYVGCNQCPQASVLDHQHQLPAQSLLYKSRPLLHTVGRPRVGGRWLLSGCGSGEAALQVQLGQVTTES